MLDSAGPWGTGPYKLVEGRAMANRRSDRVVLEASSAYWDPRRLPRVHRIIFDNTLTPKLYNPTHLFAVNKAVEFVPYVTTFLNFAETTVTEQHWSIRKQKAVVPEYNSLSRRFRQRQPTVDIEGYDN